MNSKNLFLHALLDLQENSIPEFVTGMECSEFMLVATTLDFGTKKNLENFPIK